jgi:hypothetical protein
MDKREKNLNKNNNTITFLKNCANKNEYIFKNELEYENKINSEESQEKNNLKLT